MPAPPAVPSPVLFRSDGARATSPRLGRVGYVIVAILLLLAAGGYVHVRLRELPFLHGPHGYVLTDPDSYMRWRRVQRALAGEGFRIRWIDDDNAPIGRINEWTSPMTILGVASVRAIQLVTGAPQTRALELASLLLTPALGLAAMAALVALGWRAGGWPLGLAWGLAWPALEDVFIITRPGFVDHHALHQLLAIVIYGLCLRPGRRPWLTGAAGGLASALLLWATASEGIVLLAPLGVLAVVELGRSTRSAGAPTFWRGFWLTTLAGTVAAFVFEFWPQPWHTHLEMLGPWHVFILLVAVAVVEILCGRRFRLWQIVAMLATAVALIAVAALAIHGFRLDALHAVQDPKFQAMRRVTPEFHSFVVGLDTLPRLWATFGLLPLALPAALVLVLCRGDARRRLVFAATLGFAALACWQARWVTFGAPLLVMSAGLAVQRWQLRRPWLVAALPVVATLGPWLHVASVDYVARNAPNDPIRGPYSIWIALQAAADCLGTAGDRPIVLAPWDAGGVFAGTGRVRVVGSQYWSNAAGCVDTFELFTTPDQARFAALLRQREVQYILLPDLQALPGFIRECYFALHGTPATQQDVQAAAIWRIARTGDLIPCPEFAQWRPGWMLLKSAAGER